VISQFSFFLNNTSKILLTEEKMSLLQE